MRRCRVVHDQKEKYANSRRMHRIAYEVCGVLRSISTTRSAASPFSDQGCSASSAVRSGVVAGVSASSFEAIMRT